MFFKIFSQRKLQAQMASLVTSSKHVRKKYQFIQTLPENEKRLLPNLFYEARITIIPKTLQEMKTIEQYFSWTQLDSFCFKSKIICFTYHMFNLLLPFLLSQVNWTYTTHLLQMDTIFYDFCSCDNFTSYPTQPGSIWFLLSTKLKRKRENQRNRINFPKSSHLNS